MKISPLALSPLLAFPAFAQEPTPTPTPEPEETVIVVTAERNAQPISQTPSTITVIDRAQIEAKKSFDITDLIRLSPGISTAQTGSQGKSTSVFLRGTNSNHTLVLIDGIRANSPADGRFDFGTILSENIERIEVLRGPQSALYGSDAIGGVINIITRRGSGPFQTGGGVEFGSNSSNKQVVTARGSVGKGGLSFSATRLQNDGVTRNDEYKNLGASLRYDLPLGSQSNLAFIGRFDRATVGTPGQTDFSVDPNAISTPREAFGGLEYTGGNAKRRDKITFGLADRRLDFNDDLNPGTTSATGTTVDSLNKSRVLSLDAQTAFNLSARNTLTFGGETRRERASVDSVASYSGFASNTDFGNSTRTNALFLQDEARLGRLTLTPGVRFERNSQFGNNTSGRLGAAYDLDAKSKIKASYGTAFKAPTFNDLYFPGYGTSTLNPERSKGYEIGYARQIRESGRVEITAFRNQIRDLIAGVSAPTAADPSRFIAANINSARTQGVEIGLDMPITSGLRAVVNQSFLSTDSTPKLLRRPKFATTADLIAQRDKISLDFGLVAQGRRFDNDFNGPPYGTGRGAGIYGGFTRFDLTLGYAVKPGVEVYGRFNNLFDRDYEEAAGFRTQGRNFVLGVRTAAF